MLIQTILLLFQLQFQLLLGKFRLMYQLLDLVPLQLFPSQSS